MGRFYFKQKTQGKFYRFNERILAAKLRVIGPDGKQIGVLSKWEALQKAREFNLDLVEVAPGTNPPVAKIIDFKKFKYIEAKKESESKKAGNKKETKEIRLGPFTAKADLEFRIKKAKAFLKSGDRVKITVNFRGREITKKEFGYEIIKKFTENLVDVGKSNNQPKLSGKQLIIFLDPNKNESKN